MNLRKIYSNSMSYSFFINFIF
uniref:Uncharacterized protein n=1 Tax=Heterorhabditis bacteriophora TaxID=37862 RepID=A0A1I7WX88_HETBA